MIREVVGLFLGQCHRQTSAIRQVVERADAAAITLGKPSDNADQPFLVTRHSLREARRNLRILVAEDNAVNQMLVIRLLEKRGHSVTVVNNGREALTILEKTDFAGFDAVLMDLQMPEMDGFQATAAIREREKMSGQHLPIIALTAHAMKGDEERCLAAGMDGYITKPIRAEDLIETIENLGLSADVAGVIETAKPWEQASMDTASALARVEGDVELLKELGMLFLQELPEILTNLREAVMAGNANAIERSAHKLKGSVSNFSARPAFEAALNLEVLGREGTLSEAERAYAVLEKEIGRLKTAMAKLGDLEVLP